MRSVNSPSTPPSDQGEGLTTPASTHYGMSDFAHVRKFDAHVHLNVDDPALVQLALEDGFELMTINVDAPDFTPIAGQRAIAIAMADAYPGEVHWSTSFSMSGFGQPGWTERVTEDLATADAEGARAVKFWKDIGMGAEDPEGHLVMLDHPELMAVAEQARALGLALIGHQGEPHNCWLPLEEMTTENDRRYFSRRPQYHMYLHPELPGHDDLIAMRDRFLTALPGLRFVGAHLGSLEHDVDQLSAFLDRFPDATVDMSSRMSQLQFQSLQDRERVRDFFLRYQDRVLYGTDLSFHPSADPVKFCRAAHGIWTSDWRYLATDESQRVNALDADVPGLALPRDVIDKIYYGNAVRVFELADSAHDDSAASVGESVPRR